MFVDDLPVIDRWHPQDATFSVDTALTSGTHTIRIEYFEAAGNALASVSYARLSDPPPPPGGGYQAEYFANPDLVGPPVLTRQEPQIDHNWGNGSPDPAVPVNDFSARWTTTTDLVAGTYQFTTTTDDGVRLFVDGTLVINHWVPQPPTTRTGVIALTAGAHQIVMEYFEEGDRAVAHLTYAPTTG